MKAETEPDPYYQKEENYAQDLKMIKDDFEFPNIGLAQKPAEKSKKSEVKNQ